jgi:DNA-binding beta-propeller fold protein YncE
MLETFQCPKCGAPVSYERDVVGANLTAKCSYCNSSLSVPTAMRPAQVINIDLRNTAAGGKIVKLILVILLVPVIGLVIGAIAMGGFMLPLLRSTPSVKNPPTRPSGGPSVRTGEKDSSSTFATLAFKFGDEGIGPGMFKDARSIALDGSGNIYVGEYIGGRIQVFDSTGKFMTQWVVDPKMPLRGLAADRKGTVYVVQSGKITRHEGETGNLLGDVAFAGGWGFDDLRSTPDGGLVAAWYRNRDDIVRFNSSGQVVQTIRQAISAANGDSELDTKVAVDGVGNIYALGTFHNAVFKFGPDGKFLTRFGDAGEQPGQFRAASAIAVDGKGRVYVSDIKGIQVFDTNGRYLTVFKPEGMAFGLVFNDKGELFIAARKQVLRYSINE